MKDRPLSGDSHETIASRGGLREVAVVGGGPAGLSAAIWLGRMLHDVVVIDSGDPRNWETRGIHGFMGSPDARPAELRETGRESCRAYDVELVDDCVEHIERVEQDDGESCFTLTLSGGRRIEARRVLLASGVRDFWPELPGLAPAYGRTVHTCPLCDGYDVRDGRAVVVGTGRHATHMVLELATWTQRIVMCTLGRPPELDADCRACLDELGVEVCRVPARALHQTDDGESCWLELEDGGRLDFDHLFIALGQTPSDDLAAQLGCKRDARGRVCIDGRQTTSVPNVFAAGDLTPGPQLAIKAAGEGAVAALGIHKSLLPERRRLDD